MFAPVAVNVVPVVPIQITELAVAAVIVLIGGTVNEIVCVAAQPLVSPTTV